MQNSSNALRWWITTLLFLVLSFNLSFELAAKDKNSVTIVQGIVFLIDEDRSTIMVDTKVGTRRLVVYNHDTKFRRGRGDKAQESAIRQLQKYQYISCRGMPDDSERLMATECWHRDQR